MFNLSLIRFIENIGDRERNYFILGGEIDLKCGIFLR